jgi:hypothetical protein
MKKKKFYNIDTSPPVTSQRSFFSSFSGLSPAVSETDLAWGPHWAGLLWVIHSPLPMSSVPSTVSYLKMSYW